MLVLAFSLVLLLASCKIQGGGGSDGGDSPDEGDTYEGSVFFPGATVTIVTSDSELDGDLKNLYNKKTLEIGGALQYGGASVDFNFADEGKAPCKNEIVVGPTGRDISGEAELRINRLELTPQQEAECLLGYSRYCIYAKDGSLAVNYEPDEYGVALAYTVDKLISDYISGKSSLTLKNGTVEVGYVNIYEVLRESEQEETDYAWQRLRAAVGEDVTAAVRELYGLYSDGMIDWLANLYEPYTCACEAEVCSHSSMYCGGAAFYYSNSARNTVGFLPDSESTRQILAFLEDSGMVPNYGAALPEEMKAGIIRFLKSLQDSESGYFYHPQWGEGISNSRRGRDLRDCTGVLTRLDSAPTYNAPDGTKGDGVLPDGSSVKKAASAVALSMRLGGSIASAVAKVVPTAAAAPSHLADKASFEAYLESLDIRKNSYAAGNELTAQMAEIQARDKMLKEQGKDYSLVDILISFLNENQNPNTGTWDWPMENDRRSVYHANNGVLKITGVYLSAKVLIPHYDKILNNAVRTLLSDNMPDAVTDIYNVWYTLSQVKSNIESCAGSADNRHYENFRSLLMENAVTLIGATEKKLLIFLKSDGSFSYNPKYSSAVSQSAPVAVPGSEEGDVNATTICSTGTVSTMFSALGISDYMPPIYTNVDYLRFIYLIKGFDRVIKDEEPEFEVVAKGDENKGKGKYYGQSLKFDDGGFSVLVDSGLFSAEDDAINWDRLGRGVFAGTAKVNGDNVMAYGKKTTGGPYMYINLMNEKVGNAFVFETDICLIGGSTNYEDGGILQFWLDDGNKTDTVMWWNSSFAVNMEEATLDEEGEPLGRHSFAPTMKKHISENGVWHNLRLEVQDSSLAGSEIRLYLDNVLINRKFVTTANSNIDHMTLRIRGDSGVDSLILFDNMFFGSFEEIEKDDTVLIPDNVVIQDSKDKIANGVNRGQGVYYEKSEKYSDTNLASLSYFGKIGSEDNNISLDSSSGGYYSAIQRVNKDEALLFGKTTTGDPYLFLYAEENADGSKALVFETDFALASGTAPGRADNTVMQWYASQSKGVSYWYGLGISITHESGRYYLKGGGGMKQEIDTDSWYSLRIEIDDTATKGSEARIYLNGELEATFNTTSAAPYVESMMIRFMSQCTDGRIYFDNTYLLAPTAPASSEGGDNTEPPTGGDDPVPPSVDTSADYYGKGVYVNAESTLSFDGKSFADVAEITRVGSGIEASVVNIGGKEAAKFSVSWANHAYDRYSITRSGTAANLVFEADFMLPKYSSSAVFEIMPASNVATNAGIWGNQIYFRYDSASGKNYVCIRNAETADAWFVLPEGAWVNIRVEYDGINPGDAFRLIANGELVAESTLNKSLASTKGFQMQFPGSFVGTVYFDNIYLGDKASSTEPPTGGETEEPTDPPSGGEDGNEPEDGATDYYGKGVYYDSAISYTSATHASLTESGDMFENTHHGIGSDRTLTFRDGAMHYTATSASSGYGAIDFANKDTAATSLVFETDIMFSNAKFTDLRLVGSSNGGTGSAGLYALQILFAPNSGGGYDVMIKDAGTGKYTASATLPEGKWVNLRYELDGTAAGSAVRLYVNGVLVKETALSGSVGGIKAMEFLVAKDFSSGVVSFDNTYFGAQKKEG